MPVRTFTHFGHSLDIFAMIVAERLHIANCTLCFVVGVPLNAFLIWLIVQCTPKDMLSYRPILLLSIITDVAYLTTNFLVVPVFAIQDGRCGIFSLGLLGDVPQPWGFALILFWMAFVLFSEYQLCVPFIYRYFVVCRDKDDWGVGVFLAMLLAPVSLIIGHNILMYYTGYAEDPYAANAFYSFDKNYSIPYFSHNPKDVAALDIILVNIVNYTLIFTLSWLIHRHLARMVIASQFVAKRIRSRNKQVTTTLLVQALIPFVVEYLPCMSLTGAAFSGFTLGNSSPYMVLSFELIPVLNPLVTMWTVTAYRQQIRKFCGLLCTNIYAARSSSAAPIGQKLENNKQIKHWANVETQ